MKEIAVVFPREGRLEQDMVRDCGHIMYGVLESANTNVPTLVAPRTSHTFRIHSVHGTHFLHLQTNVSALESVPALPAYSSFCLCL
jgi:hypothetical protein